MILVHIILSAIKALVGLSSFLTFLILKNYQASIWGFAMGLTAFILLQIHWMKYKNHISDYYTAYSLWSIAWLGFSMFAIGISGFIYNCIIYAVLRPPILPVEHSTILSVVWCFLTIQTGALLFWYARKYAHYVQIDRTKLIDTSTSSQQSTNSS